MTIKELKRGSYFRFVGIGERDVYFLADVGRAVNLTLPTAFPLLPINLNREVIRLKVGDDEWIDDLKTIDDESILENYFGKGNL